LTPDELEELKKVYGAIKCVYELAYVSGKSNPNNKFNELEFALNKLAKIIKRKTFIEIDPNLEYIAEYKIDNFKIQYKQWVQQCKEAILNVAERKTNNITQACKLIGCYRETARYIRGTSTKNKKRRKNEKRKNSQTN